MTQRPATFAYRPDIDGLRAVAVMAVVAYHLGFALPGGFVGVDIFFVISGYLITALLLDTRGAPMRELIPFYVRRIRRLLPALFVVLVATLAASLYFFLPSHADRAASSAIATAVFVSNIYLYDTIGYFTENAKIQPLLHTWSLAVEEQFYLFFPVLILGVRAIGLERFLLPLIGIIACGSFAASLAVLDHDQMAAFYLPHLRAWELLFGSLLAIAQVRGWTDILGTQRWLPETVCIAGLATLLWATLAFSPAWTFPGVFALIVCIGTGMVILAGMCPSTRCNALLKFAPFVAVGKWSYSLYLVHWPIIVFATYAFASFEQLNVKLLLLTASVACAFLLYRFVEMPFRTAGASGALQASTPQKPIVAAAVGIGAICAGAFAIKEADGFPARLPEELRQMVDRTGNLHDRRDCHFVTVARLRTDDLCRRGADATAPSFVLLGDSHADALSPAVFAAAEQISVNGIQITGNGFRPLVGVRKRGQDAVDLVTPLIDYLRARPELNTILIALFWEHQLTGRSYRHTGDVWLDAQYDGTGTAYNPIATRRGLEEFMAALPDRTFVFLGDVPTGASFDPTQAARHLFYGRDPGVAVSGISVKAYMDRSRTERQFLAMISRNTASTGDPGRHYEPIAQGICGSERCPAFEGRVPIYRDGDHLSRSGARRMIAPLREILSRHIAPAP